MALTFGIRRRTALAGALGLATMTACGSGSVSGGEATSAGQASGGANLTKLKVGVIPIVDTAPVWLGKDQGFFSEAGLDLEITTTTGGAAAVPGVVSGDFDIAFGNVVSVMVAVDKGLALKFLANGNSTSGQKPDFGAVVVKGDSAITSPKDLVGKTVSVNNLNNIGDTTIRQIVKDDGGDPKNLKFVEVAFPDAPAALDRGQVDAAWIVEPFLSQAVAAGAKVVTYNFLDFSPKLDIAGYFTKAETVTGKADLVASFTAAMNKSLEFAQANPDEVRRIVGTYTKISEADRAKMALPAFRTAFDVPAFDKLGASAVEFGTLSKAPDAATLLPQS